MRAQDAQNPSYAQVVGQETATSSPPTRQQSTPPAPTPKEGIDEFCLLVFGPHPRHTSLRSAKFAVAQVMRLTTPPIVLPLLAGRWHQPKKPSKKSARSSICINVDRSHAIHITAQQEQQLSKLLRQQYKWRCLLLKNKDAFHHQELQELQPIANPAQLQLSKPSSSSQQLGLQILQQGQTAAALMGNWQHPRAGQRASLQAAGSAAAATLPLQNRFSALPVDEPGHSSRGEATPAVTLAALTAAGAATAAAPPAAEDIVTTAATTPAAVAAAAATPAAAVATAAATPAAAVATAAATPAAAVATAAATPAAVVATAAATPAAAAAAAAAVTPAAPSPAVAAVATPAATSAAAAATAAAAAIPAAPSPAVAANGLHPPQEPTSRPRRRSNRRVVRARRGLILASLNARGLCELTRVTSGRMRAGLRTYALFVDVVKAFPSVWRDGLWYKLWEMGIRGKMFRVLVHLYDSLSRCALHNGESSEYFSSDLGLAEGDPLSPLLYTLFINGLLKEIWEKHPGVPLPKEVDNSGSGEQGIGRADESNIEGRSKLVALMLADDLVGLAESQEELQKMADTIHAYSRKWRFKLSPTKSAVVVFGPLPPNKESPKVSFSSENLPVLDAYTYLGIVFTSDCKWDAHIAGMIEKATASINALQTFFQNRHVSFEVKRAMLLALIRPRVEYGSEVWWASSQQTNTIESKIQIEVLKRSLHCKPNICHEVLRAEAGVRPLSSWLDQRKVEWWFKLQQKDTTSFSRQALEASWPSHRNYTSWQKRFNKLRAELGMQEETLQARVREGHLPSFRAYVRWSIYERDRAVREEGARNKSTLATYMQHYNDDINYFKPQPYLCTGPLSKGMELIMQLRAGILPLNAMTAKFGRQSASRQSARRECCKSCDLGPELGGEVESPEHFLFDCPVYQAQRQKLWEKLTSDPDVAAKCQILDGKSDEEKLHSMLNEEFWGVDVDEESGLVYGPFKHAFKCIAKYVAAAWKIRNAYAHPSDVA